MKDSKTIQVNVKVNQRQSDFLDELIKSGKVKTRSAAVNYLIENQIILGVK